MPRLNDTQRVILRAAAEREDGAVLPLPKSLKARGAALTRTLEALRKKGLLEQKPAPRDAEAWREDGRRLMLVITDAGLEAIDGGPAEKPAKKSRASEGRRKRPRTGRMTAGPGSKGQKAASAVRQGTKQALLIDLLKRKTGAAIEEIVEATGWQAHSVRGAISGTLKKKLGLKVASEKVDGRGRVYRIGGRG